MTSLSTKFMQNSLITRFGELAYFVNVKTLGTNTDGSFNSCSNLQYTDTSNVTYITGGTGSTGSTGSPFGYTSIVELNLPNLTRISQYALKPNGNNSNTPRPLLRVTIGDKFTTISNQYAFAYPQNAVFKILATTPPAGSTLARIGCKSTTYMYVPDASVDDYKAASAFANWASYIKPLSECPW